MRVAFAIGLCFPLVLTGCELSSTAPPTSEPGLAVRGSIHGGQQPIYQSHVYLMAANTLAAAGPGIGISSNNASVSLLTGTGNSDSVGSYVLTGMNGGFTFPSGSYSCSPGTQVYVYALGGDSGYGTNQYASLMAALGNCPSSGTFATQVPFISVNEVSTIAAAYAFAGYATDSLHVSSSGSTAAQLGIQNAFANATNLADIGSGAALATTPGGNGAAPQQTVNTLANIIAACINTGGTNTTGYPCYTLFNNTAVSKTLPTDTATAAINIAQSPASNKHTLYKLGTSPPVPFGNALSSEPTDFTLGITYTDASLNNPKSIAIDGSGFAWVVNQTGNSVTTFSPLGVAASYSDPSLNSPAGIAIDFYGDAWITNNLGNTITAFYNSGSPVYGSPFTDASLSSPTGIAIDGSGKLWVANTGGSSVTEFSSSGTALGSYSGGGLNDPYFDAIDGSGNIWVENNGNTSVSELAYSGSALSPDPGGWPGGGLVGLFGGIAIDNSGDAWITGYTSNSVTEVNPSGSYISGPSGFTGSGLSGPYGIAMDGSSTAWIANSVGNNVTAISNGGTVLSGSSGYTGGGVLSGPYGVAVDSSGDLWVVNNSASPASVTELIGVATPVVTPLSVAVQGNAVGSMP